MKKHFIVKIILASLMLNLCLPAFAEDNTPKPYEDDEFPQTLKDIRRFEIITLGSLPFVTLDTTLAYSTYRYAKNDFNDAYKPDIFSSSSFSQDEQRGIILTSATICLGIGITDLVVQIIRRNTKKRKRQINYDDIAVVPISQDEDAFELPLPEKDSDSKDIGYETDGSDEIEEIEEIEE